MNESKLYPQWHERIAVEAYKAHMSMPIIDKDDYIQVGAEAFVRACRSWKPKLGPLGPWLYLKIRKAMLEEKRQRCNRTCPTGACDEVPDDGTNVESEIEQWDAKRRLDKVIDALPGWQRRSLRYAMARPYETQLIDEGICKSRESFWSSVYQARRNVKARYHDA